MQTYNPYLLLKPATKKLSCASGFTLVEMLVVVTIITIMLSAGAVGLKNLAKSGGVSSAVPIAESVFSQGRELALGRGSSARVMINADPSDNEKFLRYMIVAYEWTDEDDESTKWVAESRGIYLPKGVFFSQKYSSTAHSSDGGEISSQNVDLYGGADESSSNSNLSGLYFTYEFNSQGNCITPGASFLVNVGNKAPNKQYPRVSGSSVNGFGGFVIWKKGTTSEFRHPDQTKISGVNAGSEF